MHPRTDTVKFYLLTHFKEDPGLFFIFPLSQLGSLCKDCIKLWRLRLLCLCEQTLHLKRPPIPFMEMCCKSRKLASKCRAFFLFLNSSFTSLFILRRKGPGLFFFVGENIFLSLTPCSVLPQMVKVLLFLFSQNPKTIHLIKSRVSVP